MTDLHQGAPAAADADEFICLDSTNVHELARIAKEKMVSGIVAEQTDVAVLTAAEVAELCRLPGIGKEVAKRSTNKKIMRDVCSAAGVPVPKYRCVHDAKEAVEAAKEIGLPVIVKPTDSQSSKGVAKVWNINDIPLWFSHAISESKERKVLVEEMLVGIESSVESYINNGTVTVLGVCEKIKSPPPFSFDTRLVYPANFSIETMAQLRSVNTQVVRAIGIPFGIAHAEYIVTPKGVYLIEVAARGCGAGVASTLLPAMIGFDPIRARILDAVGKQQTPPVLKTNLCGVLEFLMLPRGEISSIEGLEAAAKIPGVLAVDYFVKSGDRIEDIRNGAERPGYCIVVGKSHFEVRQTISEVQRIINVRMR